MGECSDLAIPPMGAPESLRRSGPEARRDRAPTRAQRAILTVSPQGFRMRAPEGWPGLASRALPLTLRRAAHTVGCGGRVRDGADVARRAKGRQPTPGASQSPGGQLAEGGCRADLQSALAARGAPACTVASPGPARSARP